MPSTTLPAHIAPMAALVDGSAATQRQLLLQAAGSLSPQTLVAIEQLADAYIDRRYPNDPRSLFNLRYWQGQQRKKQLRKFFDEAHDRLIERLVQHVETVREITLNHHLAMLEDAFYAQRRGAQLQRHDDQLAQVIRAGLAYDTDFQRQVVLDRQAQDRWRETSATVHQQTLDAQRATAEIAKAQRLLDQPHALQLKLYDVLASLSQYQMTLADRANRNPAIADRLRMMGLGLTAVMTSVQGLIAELNAAGEHQPTSEQVRQQSTQILNMAMEQMQQWQQETRQERSP